jgi:pimeloyl-ACP methyl ester carboxylesterase
MSLPGVKTEMVGERRVEYSLSRHEGPTVVFENGLGGGLQWWAKVFPEVAKGATAFAYNRPGTGASEVATTPRDGAHVVTELRSLLESKGLKPPYILVGHSLGGLYMQYFARRYPSEVAGLVLVDSTHPRQLQGAGAKENWPGWFRTLIGVTLSAASEEELKAANSIGEQVLNLPAPPNMLVTVLTATEPSNDDSDLARDAIAKRKDIARLYPGSRHIWVKGGHAIPLEHPEAVIEAIRELAGSKTRPEASPSQFIASMPGDRAPGNSGSPHF